MIVDRCRASNTKLSFCGEDAGRPVEAACFAAMGLHTLSMRPASIGPVKNLLRRIDLLELRRVIDTARKGGAQSVRPAVQNWLSQGAGVRGGGRGGRGLTPIYSSRLQKPECDEYIFFYDPSTYPKSGTHFSGRWTISGT